MKNMRRILVMLLVLIVCAQSFAAVVSDNDGSAFITKAEYDSLKNNFQSQLDIYNTSIDAKIDTAISAYLSGISLATETSFRLDPKIDYKFPLYSCIGQESTLDSYKGNNDPRFSLPYPNVDLQTASLIRRIWTNGITNVGTSEADGMQWSKGTSFKVSKNNKSVSFYIELDRIYGAGVAGKYFVCNFATTPGWWTIDSYQSGFPYLEKIERVQDLVPTELLSGWNSQGWSAQAPSGTNTAYRRYFYPCCLCSSANNLNNTTNTTKLNKWESNTDDISAMGNWFGINSDTANQDKLGKNYNGKNITLTDFKKLISDCGWSLATGDCANLLSFIGDTGVRGTKIEVDRLFGGADAYACAFSNSGEFCYQPDNSSGTIRSRDYSILMSTNWVFTLDNYFLQTSQSGKSLQPLLPYRPYLVPALSGTTNNTNYTSTSKFSQIPASKLHWTDQNGDSHSLADGLFIIKMPNDGAVKGKMKFSEAGGEKVWCAFSKHPFSGDLSTADTLEVVANGVTKSKTDLLYDANIDYTFQVNGLKSGDSLYMFFKSSSGSKCPTLDYFNDLYTVVDK